MTDTCEDTETMNNADEDDERIIELSSLLAIFPELIIDDKHPLTATLEVPIAPSKPVPVLFKATSDKSPMNAGDPQHRIHLLSYLPNVQIDITLPNGYPAQRAPVLSLSTTPEWLSTATKTALVKTGEKLWEDIGHDQMLYLFVDHIQDSALEAFGLLNGKEYLQLSAELEIELLDHDKTAKQKEFDRQSYDCGICLEPKRGSACHKLDNCGHIFCRKCLQDFYNNAITEGDLDSVKCLDPGCAKRREDELAKFGKKRKPKVTLAPSELLRIPLEHESVKRYVTMRHKIDLENDKSTIYCPRSFCDGAARSKKHKKPIISLTFATATDDSDEESDDELVTIDPTKPPNRADLLRVCEDCSFAFCSRCLQTWHGEYVVCGPPRNTDELTAEDKASLDYIKFHTTPCPTCAVPAQKTHGCNHMKCQRCGTHFCYLCSAWLDQGNPYQHYNTETTGCYQRLWELEGGDGDDVGYGYNGGGHPLEDEELLDEEHDIGSDDGLGDDDFADDLDDRIDHHLAPRFQVQPNPEQIEAEENAGGPPGPLAAQPDVPLAIRIIQALPLPAPAPQVRQPNPPPAPGRLGGRFARAAARRAAAEAEAAERAREAQLAIWNRHINGVNDVRQVRDDPDAEE